MDSDRRETTDDKGILLRAVQQGLQATIWTALPAIVTRYDPARMTCECQPAIKATVLDRFGKSTWVQLPLLVDCPVVFPSAGGFSLTFPVAPGDEVLVVFSSRCIDSWWQSGGVQIQAELRMHDLSDGYAIPGPRSQPRVLSPAADASKVQLRADDGSALVSIDPDGEIDLTTEGNVVVTAAEATVNAPAIVLNGNVTVNGTISADDFIPNEGLPAGPAYLHHKHDVLHGTDLGPPVAFP